MKKIFLIISSVVFMTLTLSAQNVFMYDRTGQKTFFQKVDTVQFVHLESASDILKKASYQSIVAKAIETEEMLPSVYKLTTTSAQKKSLKSAIKQSEVQYTSSMLLSKEGDICWESENIFVTVFPGSDLPAILKKMLSLIPILNL